MSGGSYNYLSSALDLEDLLTKFEDLERMADRLAGLSEVEFPGAHAAAQMTRELLVLMNLWTSHAIIMAKLLRGVWHDVEWWDSNDYGPDQVRDVLQKLLATAPMGVKPE
jgi:hypothetical protein